MSKFKLVGILSAGLIVLFGVQNYVNLSLSESDAAFTYTKAAAQKYCASITTSTKCNTVGAASVPRGYFCEWPKSVGKCVLPSCGNIVKQIGRNDATRYEVGCFSAPNQANPDDPNGPERWVFAGFTSDCNSGVVPNPSKPAYINGCFWRAK